MNDHARKIIIIGSGPAGLTAGVYAARANLKPLIIEGATPGGQLMSTTAVENWPGEIGIMGPQLMQNMRKQAEYNGCEFIQERITSVDFSSSPYTLFTHKNKTLQAHTIIIATGATPKKLKVPGEDTYWGRGVTTCAVCDGAFYKNVPVVIVGGGDTAVEDASFMTKFTDDITIVQIHDKLSATAVMQERVIHNPKIKIVYNSTVREIIGNEQHPEAITIANNTTGEITKLPARAVFVAIGLTPNTEPFKGQLELSDYGYLLLHNETHTSQAGIFGAGDVADSRYRQAITSAGAGCMAALDAERYLSEHKLL